MLGKNISVPKFEKFYRSDKKCVLDNSKVRRVIFPEEFYHSKGPVSLHWDELAYLDKMRSNVFYNNLFGFDGLMDELLLNLEKKGLMSLDRMCKGDYYLLNVGGIDVKTWNQTDSHGRSAYSTKTYYPRVKEDAEEYAKHFWGDACYPVHITQVLSVGNKDWMDISPKKYEERRKRREELMQKEKLEA